VSVTAEQVKILRERTGVGMGKCKEALIESNGNLEEAIDYLRKKGIANAAKKESREANEGMIKSLDTNGVIAIVEVNAETDFVVKNEAFQKYADAVVSALAAHKVDDLESFLASKMPGTDTSVDERRLELVSQLGENIKISRVKVIEKKDNASFGLYNHMNGKIVTLVEIDGTNDQVDLARGIAMHAAAEAPQYLSEKDIPESVVMREQEIAKEQVKGKPENIIDKIVAGKIGAFYDTVCLLRQSYIKEPDLKIAELVEKKAKETGKQLSIPMFVRMQIGA
jgi:elongation factor Ts